MLTEGQLLEQEGALPSDLTQFSRLLAASLDEDTTRGPSLSQFLPNRTIDGIKTRATRVSRTQTTAKFRGFDAPTPVGKRPVAVSMTEIELAPLGQTLPIREHEIIMKALQTGDYAEIVRVIYDDARTNVGAIRNSMERLRAGLLFSGMITINENGFIQEADYGLAADHNLDAGDVGELWSVAATDSFEQEMDWVKTFSADADAPVVAAIISQRIFNNYVKLDVVKEALVAVRSINAVNALRSEYNLPPFVIYDKELHGERLTPDNKISYVTDTVGETQWGLTAEALELFGSNAIDESTTDAPAIATAAWTTRNPVNVWTKSDATALPVIGDINGLAVVEVLAESIES